MRAHTRPVAPPLTPELVLYTADALTTLWQTEQRALEALGIDTPFWCVPWAGGQALARYLLDAPSACAGCVVLDLGCGGGIAALAAARGGARRVLANDPDPLALTATALNAALNGVALECLPGDLLDGTAPPEVELVIAADLWFDDALSRRVTPWLRAQARAGRRVLIGDPGRAYLPQRGARPIAEYTVPTSTEIERTGLTRAGVWQLLG